MKKYITRLLLVSLAMFVVAFVSCSKDDEENKNKFTYELNEYILDSGHQVNYGASGHNPATYEYDVVLAGPGITWDNAEADIKGKGNYISFTIFSTKPDFIAGGSYVFDGFASKDSLTFIDGEVGMNFDYTAGVDTAGVVFEVKTGMIMVKKRGNLYEFNLDLTSPSNMELKGMYIGTLESHTATIK